MKRLRSYGDDLDSIGEKGFAKDCGRREPRDPEVERPSSSHRRFYLKPETGRKGSSSSSGYDRSFDTDDRDASRAFRKRSDHHDSDGFDRRKGFDRYRDRDGGDRSISISSPRSGYVERDRLHRSESFCGSRREFPKGLRSDRDRSRREENVSLWRRFGRTKDMDDDVKPSFDAPKSSRVGLEERGTLRSPKGLRDVKSPTWSKDSGGELAKKLETRKNEEMVVESGNNSEMEEGELEPEPKPELASEPEPLVDCEVDMKTGGGKECQSDQKIKSDSNVGNMVELVSASEEKRKSSEEGVCNKKLEDGGARGFVEHDVKESDKADFLNNCIEDVVMGKQEEVLGAAESESERLDVFPQENCESSPLPKHIVEKEGKSEEVVADGNMFSVEETTKGNDGLCVEIQKDDIFLPESRNNDIEKSRKVESPPNRIKDKGKSLAKDTEHDIMISRDSLSCQADAMEGPSSRGFELFFSPSVTRPDRANRSDNANKDEDGKLLLEPLELSLALPNVSLPLVSHDSVLPATSPPQAKSFQSLAASVRTSSDGFTTSISFSGSQPFVHNYSCSLNCNSLDNYEQSVGSRPIFQGVDWQGMSTNDHKQNDVPFYQKVLPNGNGSSLHHSNGSHAHVKALEGSSGMPLGLYRSLSLQNGDDKKPVVREESGGVLFRSSSNSGWDGEQIDMVGAVFVEKIIALIISEPIQVTARTFQDMSEQSIMCLKEGICEMIMNEGKRSKLSLLQDILKKRSDLTLEVLSKAHRAQLEILVALKTGIQDFLSGDKNILSADLAEIFLNLKCRNLDCRSVLPFDECECKICGSKNGFCSACMCLVCSKYDMASNTCSWVGCDVCSHWCHTECGLRGSFIRNGHNDEMQFYCVACGHPSEMYGFVKDVFKTCASEWKVETMVKELRYVMKIFSCSKDVRGKMLYQFSVQMLDKLQHGCSLVEAYNHIMGFLNETDSKFGDITPLNGKELAPTKNQVEGSNGVVVPNQESVWLKSIYSEKSPHVENAGNILPNAEVNLVGRRKWDSDVQMNLEEKPVPDELESVVKIKLAEAKMFQTRADDARREAEGLKKIAFAKNEKIEEEFRTRITKLRMAEVEERRRIKSEEVQILERRHREYFNMKMRMESDIKDLLLKMEATKQNIST